LDNANRLQKRFQGGLHMESPFDLRARGEILD
jgi:hypothetical protein